MPDLQQMQNLSLNEWAMIIHQYSREKGWWSTDLDGKTILDRNFGEMMMLITSEAAEALEEHRAGRLVTETYYNDGKEMGDGKPEGIPSELIDIIIRVLDICGAYKIDVDAMMVEKHSYNSRRAYRHGGKLA